MRVSHRPGGGGFRLGLRLALAVEVCFGFGVPQAAVSCPKHGGEPGGLVTGCDLDVSSGLADPGNGGVLVQVAGACLRLGRRAVVQVGLHEVESGTELLSSPPFRR